jgi:hypothetical protein
MTFDISDYIFSNDAIKLINRIGCNFFYFSFSYIEPIPDDALFLVKFLFDGDQESCLAYNIARLQWCNNYNNFISKKIVILSSQKIINEHINNISGFPNRHLRMMSYPISLISDICNCSEQISYLVINCVIAYNNSKYIPSIFSMFSINKIKLNEIITPDELLILQDSICTKSETCIHLLLNCAYSTGKYAQFSNIDENELISLTVEPWFYLILFGRNYYNN